MKQKEQSEKTPWSYCIKKHRKTNYLLISRCFMRHRGFEPRTTWLKVKCSTNWANIPYAQNRNRTSDTRIFSPLLYQLSYLGIKLRGKDLNQRPPGYEPDELPDCSTPRYEIKPDIRDIQMGGGGFEPPKQFAADLQSVPFGHSGIHPYSIIQYNREPMNGLEPLTCWLQISCSANWATSAKWDL